MKRTTQKAFTLIELLAVIVILAIIALIAVPVILNIIDKANKSAFKDSAYGVLNAAEYFYAASQLELEGPKETIEMDTTDSRLELKGSVPTGKVSITRDGEIALAVSNERYCIIKGFDEEDVTVIENYESCQLPDSKEEIKILENFADNKWTTIAWACKNNMVPETWNIGDTKEMQIGNHVVGIRIIGKNHDTYSDGSGTAPLTFETTEVIGPKAMFNVEPTVYNYANSDMRQYLNNSLINELESGIGAQIKEVTKKTFTYSNKKIGEITTSSDKIFILSAAEIYDLELEPNSIFNTYTLEGKQYAYYASNPESYGSDSNSYAFKCKAGTSMAKLTREQALEFYYNYDSDNPEDKEKIKEIAEVWMLRTPAQRYGPALHSASLLYGVPGLSLGKQGDHIHFDKEEYFSIGFCF